MDKFDIKAHELVNAGWQDISAALTEAYSQGRADGHEQQTLSDIRAVESKWRQMAVYPFWHRCIEGAHAKDNLNEIIANNAAVAEFLEKMAERLAKYEWEGKGAAGDLRVPTILRPVLPHLRQWAYEQWLDPATPEDMIDPWLSVVRWTHDRIRETKETSDGQR